MQQQEIIPKMKYFSKKYMKNNATTEIGKTIDNRYSMTFIVVASYTAVLFSPKNQKQTDHHTTTNTQESEYLTTRMRK